MKIPKIFDIFIGLALLVSGSAYGATIKVPDDYPTIQAAIDAAANGDIVEVADGTYKGTGNRDLDFNGKEITVRSKNGPKDTIIDCENMGRGFFLHSGETNKSVIKGFTITNGSAGRGGGINVENASVEIVDCMIIDNSSGDGGGISCRYGSINISNTIIKENYCLYRGSGGGLNVWHSSLIMKNSFVIGNSAPFNDGGGFSIHTSSCEIVNSVIADNSSEETGGGLVFEYGSDYKLTNCTIVGNQSPNAIGAAISVLNDAHVTLTNCIVSDNVGTTGLDEKYCAGNSSITLNYCDTFNNSPDGCVNITRNNCLGSPPTEGLNPLFVDLENDDYHLQAGSPCMDAGTADAPLLPDFDFEGDPRIIEIAPDMGADEYQNQRPVAYYPFNGNANDESGNGNHGTIHGATLTADRFGNANSAYSFEWNDYIEVNNPLSLQSFTISVWFEFNPDYIDNRRIFTIHDGLDPDYYYFDIEGTSRVTINTN